MTVLLLLLGAPTIAIDGAVQPLPFERRTQLLAHLALKRRWIARDEIAALLWPEQDTRLAQANLRKALFRLQALAGADRLETQGRSLRIDVPTDIVQFDQALREGRIADALALRRGPLLAGFDDHGNEPWTAWLSFERERERNAWRGALQQHLRGEVPAAQAIELAQQLLDDDPLDEDALRLYMDRLTRAGHAARARQAGREFSARLRDELGIEPSAELRTLLAALAAAPAATTQPAALRDAAAAGSFIGRTVELRRIGSLLAQDDCRLLCLTGPGGVGKTSLARQAMQACAGQFAEGARFVALEEVASTEGIGTRIAHEIDLKLTGRAETMQQVIDFLLPREMLLVLDNFEHLVDGARQLEPLLTQCPRVKLLVTSRVRLALPQEWLLPLDGLPCPDDEDEDHLEAFDAARLFVRAAQRVAPGLVPAAEAPAIVDICRQLGGLPLALELAAAWTRVLTCAEIAAELRHGTELLHTADATRPARHASLDVVFDKSWQLLTPVERAALARLSVFRGGFTAEAARAVAQAPLPVLAALTDKSLLRKDDARLHLHPLVQQLAAGRLGAGPERDATHAAHAAHYLRLLTQLRNPLAAGDGAALRVVDDEFDNCRRAWTAAIQAGAASGAAQAAKALLDLCDFRGRQAEGLTLFSLAVDSPLAQADPAFGAQMRSQLAHVLYRLDRYPEAEANAQLALQAARKDARDTRRQAFNVLATCALRLGRLAQAREYFQQALDETTAESQARHFAATLDHLALVEKGMGNFDEALRLGLQALTQHRNNGDAAAEALCLSNLGSLRLARQEHAAAVECLATALAICEREGLVSTQQYVLSNLTEATMHLGDLVAAEAHVRRLLASALATHHRALVGSARLSLARIARRRGNLDAARAALAEGAAAVLPLGVPILKFDALACLAELLRAQGEGACARRVLAYATRHPDATPGARAQLQQLLDEDAGAPGADDRWPALELDDLLMRIVDESQRAFAPLIGTLRAA